MSFRCRYEFANSIQQQYPEQLYPVRDKLVCQLLTNQFIPNSRYETDSRYETALYHTMERPYKGVFLTSS